jgi:hypothetical protein
VSFDEFEAEGADMVGDAIAEDSIAYLKTINSGALGLGGLERALPLPPLRDQTPHAAPRRGAGYRRRESD